MRVGSLRSFESQNILDEVTEARYSDGLLFSFAGMSCSHSHSTSAGSHSAVNRGRSCRTSRESPAAHSASVAPDGSLAFLRRMGSESAAQLTWFIVKVVSHGSVGSGPDESPIPRSLPTAIGIGSHAKNRRQGPAIWLFENERGTVAHRRRRTFNQRGRRTDTILRSARLRRQDVAVVAPADHFRRWDSGFSGDAHRGTRFQAWALGWSHRWDAAALPPDKTRRDDRRAGLWFMTMPIDGPSHFGSIDSSTRKPRYRPTAAGIPTPRSIWALPGVRESSRRLDGEFRYQSRVGHNRDGGAISRSCTFCRRKSG